MAYIFKYVFAQPSWLYFAATAVAAAWILLTMPRTWTHVGVFLVLGPTTWTLEEYMIHRFVLHGGSVLAAVHAKHHERPADEKRIFVPMIITGFLGVIHYVPLSLCFEPWIARAVLASHILCYWCFEWVHYDCHILRSAFLMGARRFHSLHHSSYACPKNYGFTSASWDLVFGTCDAATKRGWAILWIPIPVLPLLLYNFFCEKNN
jgi:sterol desaturase/sphingolipid hydroxylase (fatty acid hydroxylase superfamily)